MHAQLATAFILGSAAVSAFFYRHRGRPYAAGKSEPIGTLPGFAAVYRLIQISTIVVGCSAVNSEAPWLLKVHSSLPLLYAGMGMAAAGLLLFVWAKRALGSHYSPCFDSLVPAGLAESGPYRYVRHPIYSANTLLVLGFFLMTGSLWLLANLVVLLVYYTDSARREEAALAKRFPEYAAYQARTGKFLPRRV